MQVNSISDYTYDSVIYVMYMCMSHIYNFAGIPFIPVISCGSMVGLQNRQMKEALFIKKVQQNVKEEQANHLRW